MQVTVENTGGLAHKLTIQFPWNEIETREQQQLEETKKKANIPGFRPGKAPLPRIKQLYGEKIRYDVVTELMKQGYVDALKAKSLSPAGFPDLAPEPLQEGQPFVFTATFEVFPEIELVDLSGEAIETDASEVSENDIDETIEKLRQQMKRFEPTEDKAAIGYRMTINFEGFIDDQSFSGNKAEDFKLVLGESRMIPGFEDAIIGMQANEEKTISVTFPEEYPATELAGKPATFNIHATLVEKPVLPEIDANFIKEYGIEDGEMATLRTELRNELERELNIKTRMLLKQAVFDKLLSLNQFEIPAVLIQNEIERLKTAEAEYFKQRYKVTPPAKEDAAYEPEARRRVTLGLLLNKLITMHQMKPNHEKIMDLIKERLAIFSDPNAMLPSFFQNENLMEEIKEIALEDQIVDLLLEKAELKKNQKLFADMMAQ